MNYVWAALQTAEFAHIVALSLTVCLSATAVAAVVGLPCGAALAICQFPGRRLLILLANSFLGLPPVVVGLAFYLLLSRSGPLGALALLFTPSAMVIAQALLAAPIITALTHRAIEELGKNTAAHSVSMAQPGRGRSGCFWRSPAALS